MKKGRFIALISVLLIILLVIVGFLYFYHEPYSIRTQQINAAKNEVLRVNNIDQLDQFHQYNSHNIYYIGQDSDYVYVFNENYQLIKQEDISLLNLDLVKERLTNDYQVSDFEYLELGYENKTLMYLCQNSFGDITQYIYLNAQDASEIKFYELRK